MTCLNKKKPISTESEDPEDSEEKESQSTLCNFL